MQLRRRTRQTTTLEERLSAEARRLRERAKSFSPGIERERAIKMARQAETGVHINEWLRPPVLRAPT